MKKKPEDPVLVEEGSGDVFADVGIEMSSDDMLKVHIALQIARTIKKRKLTQSQAAEILEIDQPKVSKIISGQLTGFKSGRLIEYLLKLGRDIEIYIPERARNGHGQLLMRA